MRVDLGANMSANIDLTEADYQGNCLNANDNEWGTYTYDLLVLEYAGTGPVWTQGEAMDWNFLKRYKDGYHLWVPEDLPAPNGDDDGHDVWAHVPEDGAAELRGYYCLESDYGNDAVQRGNDVQIQVVDSELSERGSAASGPVAVGLIGADYGTVDADENDKWDGLSLYTYQENDPAGMWRAIFMASDNGGVGSPEWRTHTPLRMLTANKEDDWRPLHVVLDPGHGAFIDQATDLTAWRGACRQGWDDLYREDHVVVDIVSGALSKLGSMFGVESRSTTRSTGWDIGDLDEDGAPKKHYRTWDATPGGVQGFLDRRVHFTKQDVYFDPESLLVFVSVHIDVTGTGPFHVTASDATLFGASQALGDRICDNIVQGTGLQRCTDEVTESYELPWWIGSDMWTSASVQEWSREKCGGDPYAAAREMTGVDSAPLSWRRRRAVPAVIVEALHFYGDLAGGQDWEMIKDRAARLYIGEAVGWGVSTYWRDNR